MEKREKILGSALTILVEKGIHAAPMSAIADHAHTGMGTIYNYFCNKEVLINTIYTNIKNHEKGVFHGIESDRPIKVVFESYYLAVITFYLENAYFFRFMDQLHASPIITEESKVAGYQAIEPFIKLIERGQSEGIIKKIALEELLQFVGGTVFSYLRWCFEHNSLKDKSHLQNQLKLVWDAIKE